MRNLILWAIPKGKTERHEECLISEKCRHLGDIDQIMNMAAKDGFHSFRVSSFTDGDIPDFIKTINL